MASSRSDRHQFGDNHSAINPCSVNYFYGRISRDEAESILRRNGCQEGLYLLRENMSVAGNYALSICHQMRYDFSMYHILQ
jgi:SH2 domain